MFFQIRNFMDHTYARNVAFALNMGIFCVILGSFSTALFIAACFTLIFINPKISLKELWSKSISLCKKLPVLLVFPIFFFSIFFTNLRGEYFIINAFIEAGSYWQFLVIIPASVGLFHLSRDVNFAGLFSLGCRIGLIFVVPLSFIQVHFFNLRPEGLLSHSLVFASLSIIAAGLAMIEWKESTEKSAAWGWIMFIAGIVTALLTFSRGMFVPILAITIVAIFYRLHVSSRFEFNIKNAFIILVSVVFLFILYVGNENGWQILNQQILKPIESLQQGILFDRSMNQRIDLHVTSIHAFAERPFTGYGMENVVTEINKISVEVLGRKTDYTFTHLHNDYLTHAVGGGSLVLMLFIVTLLMPIFVVWELRKDVKEVGILYFALVLSISFATIAMTNIAFHNDQLTTMFCVACMFLIVRRIQIYEGMNDVRIPHIPTIMKGINPIGLVDERRKVKV